MKTLINNFVGVNPIEVQSMKNEGLGNLVLITQSSGALSFQHSMTPQQAREMADALMVLADSFDEVTA